MRAFGAAARASWRPSARAKWPRWLVANCISCPRSVSVSSWIAITPALLTRMSSGPSHAATKAPMLASSVSSRAATVTSSLPVLERISAATLSPSPVLRTARVTEAPAPASARAVSTPIPEAAPVTIARLPVRSIPSTTSAAVESKPKGVLISAGVTRASGGPGEFRCRDSRLTLVLDPEGVDLGALRLGGVELGASRVDHADESDRLPILGAEGDDVLDLEVDCVADLDAVAEAILDHLEWRPLDADDLADHRRRRLHRTALLAFEDGGELLHLIVIRALVDEQAETPVALGHELGGIGDRGDAQAGDVRALDLALLDVEDERDAAVVIGRTVVHRHVARAHEVARARLKVAPPHAPGHSGLLCWGGSLSAGSAHQWTRSRPAMLDSTRDQRATDGGGTIPRLGQ